MGIGVGFAVLPEESLFGRSPPAGAWIALAVLGAMIAAYYMLGLRGRSPSQEAMPQLKLVARRVWTLVALLGPGLAVLSDARPLAVGWWLVAGPAFSTVLLVSAFLLVLILTHPREALFVAPEQRVGGWVITGVLLAATLCIPLVFVALSIGADRDPATSLAWAMCAAYVLAVVAALLVQHWADDDAAAEAA